MKARPASADLPPRLWLARTDAPLPDGAATWLDAGERDRLARISHADARRARAAAWSLRRWALTQARPATPPDAWRLVAGPQGKPGPAAPGLHHSLSHAGGIAAVLLADAPCGVDAEAPPTGLEAAEVVFGPAERAAVATHPRPAERFLQLWVAKEAAVKLLGTGLTALPEALQFTVAADGRSAAPLPDAVPRLPPGTTVRLWPLPHGGWLAAALPGPTAGLVPTWAPWSTP